MNTWLMICVSVMLAMQQVLSKRFASIINDVEAFS